MPSTLETEMIKNPKSGLWRAAVALTFAAAVSACGSNAPTRRRTDSGAGRRTASCRLRSGADNFHAA